LCTNVTTFFVLFEDEEEGDVAGSEMFRFKTPKKSGSMAQKGLHQST
jgi:hypothetical protein